MIFVPSEKIKNRETRISNVDQKASSTTNWDAMRVDNKAIFSGTQVGYLVVCPVKLWLYSHFIRMEQNSENVKLGKILHKESFKREKETPIDNKIAIDFIKKNGKIELHEIKKSPALEKAHYWQLMYYLYYLKKFKGIADAKGFIDYPQQKKRTEVILSEQTEKELESMLEKMHAIIEMPAPPEKKKLTYCSKCSYYEFCWGD